ncbi:MAG TPA: hypothetical protein VJN89_04610 [Candidatus Acidoferrum sp.]|nr:hypothetical protein [Candidatus Acidoferrum sp.]
MTSYWDPGYISSETPEYLEATIAHEALHGYLGIEDDDLKRAFFGPKTSDTGPAASTRGITDYIYKNLQ